MLRRVKSARVGVIAIVALGTAAAQAAGGRQLDAALADPAQAARTCMELENAGPRAVPVLVDLLARCGHGEANEVACRNALFVLARLGDRALTAIDEVRACVAFGTLAVRNQAIWALGVLAARSRDAEIASRAVRWIEFEQTPDLDPLLFRAAMSRLRLCAGEPLRQVTRRAEARSPLPEADPGMLMGITAAIAAGELAVPGEVLTMLRDKLRAAVARDELPWRDADAERTAAGELAAMFLARGEPAAGDIALGLLEHWDPLLRRRGVDALAVAHRPRAERLALVAMLWDRDPSVRRAAVAALQRAGGDALIGLRALRAFAATGDDFGAACASAADAIRGGAAGDDTRLRSLLAELDDALAGRTVPQGAGPAGAAAERAIADVLYGCRGAEAAQLARMLAFAAARAAGDPDVALAALQLLATRDAEAQRVVLHALPRLAGGLAADAWLAADLEVAVAAAPRDVRGLAIEALAMSQVPAGATTSQLRTAIGTGNARLLARVAVELTAVPDAAGAMREAVAALLVRANATWNLRAGDAAIPWNPDFGLPGWNLGSAVAEMTLARALLSVVSGLPLPPCDDARELAAELAPERTFARGEDVAAWLGAADGRARAAIAAALEAHLRRHLGLN